MAPTPALLLEDLFEVNEVDPDGKKFDKVSRIHASSALYEMKMVLDLNTDIYPVAVGDKLTICLASSLNPAVGPPSTSSGYVQSISGEPSLMDKFDYVMHGKVFKFKGRGEEGDKKRITADVYASFGGLLLQLTAEPKTLEALELDQGLYLLCRRVV